MSVDIHDKSRVQLFVTIGQGVWGWQGVELPVFDLRRRPYNTLALPCECVRQLNAKFGKCINRFANNVWKIAYEVQWRLKGRKLKLSHLI